MDFLPQQNKRNFGDALERGTARSPRTENAS